MYSSETTIKEICDFKKGTQISIGELPKGAWTFKILKSFRCLNIKGQNKIFDRLADIAINHLDPDFRFEAIGALRDETRTSEEYFSVFLQAVKDNNRGVSHIASTYFQTLRSQDSLIHKKILEALIDLKIEINRMHLAEFFIYDSNNINTKENLKLLITAFLVGKKSHSTNIQIMKAFKLNSPIPKDLIEYLSTFFAGRYEDKSFYAKDLIDLIEESGSVSLLTISNIARSMSAGNNTVVFEEVKQFLLRLGQLEDEVIEILADSFFDMNLDEYSKLDIFRVLSKQKKLNVNIQLEFIKLLDDDDFSFYIEGYFRSLNVLDPIVIKELQAFLLSTDDIIAKSHVEYILQHFGL